jgi:DNA-binding response OmpR family regulator
VFISLFSHRRQSFIETTVLISYHAHMTDIAILVIEDDREVNSLITKYIANEGYHVDFAYDGTTALEMIRNHAYQLLILDIMIPGISGLELLRCVRERERMPVIIVSAKSDESDKIIGLGIGADDYLTKPFSVKELVARVNVQIRRYVFFPAEEEQAELCVLGYRNIELNENMNGARKDGAEIPLTATEYRILKLLMENQGKVFTKSRIRDSVWSDGYCLEDNTVMVHIRNIRKKIEDDPSNPTIIKTVWGIGYLIGD